MTTQTLALDEASARSSRWKSLIAASLGWTLDAMDWMILSLALTHIGVEFGAGLAQLGMLATATLLGATISGLFVGMLADKYGRVKMLTITMVWYAAATAACGFAQDMTQLLLLRFITGVGLGGEWGIGAALVSEYWPEKYRARATSFVHSGWPIGYGLASLAYIFILPEWGWRTMFFLGIIPAFVALWVRMSVPEPEEWKQAKAKKAVPGEEKKIPLGVLFSPQYRKTTITAIVWMSGMLMAYWGAATWLPAFLSKAKDLNIIKTGGFLIVLNVGAFLGYQFYGWLADAKGRRFSMLFGCVGSIVATLIYVSINSESTLLLFGPVFGFLTYGIFGVSGAFISELYPPEVRATGTSLIFNSGRGFAMISPFLIGTVASQYGLTLGLGLTAAFSTVAIIALFLLPETRKNR